VVAIPALPFLYQAIDAVLKGLFGDLGPAGRARRLFGIV
jgi:hypothetical protein